ncbi:hypothetical protein [Nocardiopsis coralli]|nr:hypothetical protein [Nocardiopsis coralli]
MLARPGLTPYAVRRLRYTDTAFGILDALLRSGAPVPEYWIVEADPEDPEAYADAGPDAGGGNHTLDSVTCTYDALSEALRETGGVAACAAALRVAREEWECLDSALCEGAPLPEPWARPSAWTRPSRVMDRPMP